MTETPRPWKTRLLERYASVIDSKRAFQRLLDNDVPLGLQADLHEAGEFRAIPNGPLPSRTTLLILLRDLQDAAWNVGQVGHFNRRGPDWVLGHLDEIVWLTSRRLELNREEQLAAHKEAAADARFPS